MSDCLRFCFVTSLNLHFAIRCFISKSLYCKNYQVNIYCQPACTFDRGLSGISEQAMKRQEEPSHRHFPKLLFSPISTPRMALCNLETKDVLCKVMGYE